MKDLILRIAVWRDTRAQDLFEYALMAGFVALMAVAASPGVAASTGDIFSKVTSVVANAAGGDTLTGVTP
jgi:Flp pilus assembly pilin Flp